MPNDRLEPLTHTHTDRDTLSYAHTHLHSPISTHTNTDNGYWCSGLLAILNALIAKFVP